MENPIQNVIINSIATQYPNETVKAKFHKIINQCTKNSRGLSDLNLAECYLVLQKK